MYDYLHLKPEEEEEIFNIIFDNFSEDEWYEYMEKYGLPLTRRLFTEPSRADYKRSLNYCLSKDVGFIMFLLVDVLKIEKRPVMIKKEKIDLDIILDGKGEMF